VSANYKAPRDYNRAGELDLHERGWRVTGTLKCSVCKTKTRHAILRDHDEYRDFAELEERERRAVIGRRAALRRLETAANDVLRQEAQRRISDIMGQLHLKDLTLEECGDLLELLHQMIDRRTR
jgi:DNA-binding transcriptional regulator GbsR (MarR family)